MPKAKATESKKVATGASKPAAKTATAKAAAAKPETLYGPSPRNFSIGNDIQPKRDLTRFMKWPKYVRLQRQRRVLKMRLKVPPMLNQFSKTLDKHMAVTLFKFLAKYKPEDKIQKKDRLKKEAELLAANKPVEKSKPFNVKYGLNHVVSLIESKKAKLVVVAHDVDPIELVVYIPTLCKKLGIPYCIVKGKARLGQLVHSKTATCLAVVDVKNEDKPEFAKLVESLKASFNDRYDDLRKQWGGGVMGQRTQAMFAKREKAISNELSSRFG